MTSTPANPGDAVLARRDRHSAFWRVYRDCSPFILGAVFAGMFGLYLMQSLLA